MGDSKGSRTVIGIDLSDKKFDYCVLTKQGTVCDRGTQPLTERGLLRLPVEDPALVVIEAGTHSPWVSRFLEDQGHELIVANPRQLPSIYASSRKNDRNDAEQLARLARVDPALLCPIRHRGVSAQADLAQIRSRAELVKVRTALINHVRGSVKSFGSRLPTCDAGSFHNKVREEIPTELAPALLPVLDALEKLTGKIKALEKAIDQLCETKYPETNLLRQVGGVGALTALTYVLTLEDPKRFSKSRSVGAFLGLTPRQDDSGETRKHLRITKEGDKLLRRLLVGAAHYALGPFGPDCDLRRWGHRVEARGGPSGRKIAAVAVARKLGVLLHSLWSSGEVYEPLRHAENSEPSAA